jgi:deoxyribonuclease IV
MKSVKSSDVRVGVHVSIAGGLTMAVERAQRLGCQSMQVFSKSPRGWAARPLDPDDVRKAHRLRTEWGIHPFAVHGSYLLNLATPDSVLYEKSVAGLKDELVRCRMLGADYFVLHAGCRKPGQTDALSRIARGIRTVLKDRSLPRILLENTAGEQGEIGSQFQELAELLQMIASDRVGICLDTCHTLAAGYDITTPRGTARLMREIDDTIGLPAIQFIHANDSKRGLASHVDRHEHIGSGAVGSGGFRYPLWQTPLRHIPMVLETPKESEDDDTRNLRAIRRFAHFRK